MLTPTDLRIEELHEGHTLDFFESYEQDLVEFLQKDALGNQRLALSKTFMWFYKEQLVGYISLLTDRIKLEGELQQFFREKGVRYSTLPSLKIGRLCVDNKFLRQGIGTEILNFAAQSANRIRLELAGCRFLTVDAKNTKGVVSFYQKYGFEILQNGKMNTTLYIDLHSLDVPQTS